MQKGEKRLIISNRIREFRKLHGISRQKLADAIGISKNAIVNIEYQKCAANQKNAEAIADFFGTDVNKIFYIK